jgi:tetratricopeptide (TPR) repeat protein
MSRFLNTHPNLLPGLFVIAGLIVLMVFSASIRFRQYESNPMFDNKTETALFQTESALQYRYARLEAMGAGIPELDRRAQWPQGLDTRKDLTVVMERVIGKAWRAGRALGLLPEAMPFHLFAIGFVCISSSLTLIGIYLAARALRAGRISAMAAAALWCMTPASFDRVRFFEYEYFAVPWIAAFLASLLAAAASRSRGKIYAVLGAVCLFVALCSWHMTGFVLLLFALATAFVAAVATPSQVIRLRWPLAGWVFALASATLLSQAVRQAGLLTSPTGIFCICLAAGVWSGTFAEFGRIQRLGIVAVAGCLSVMLGWMLSNADASYGHVWALALAKLRYLGVKPADPASLGFEARSLWLASHATVTPAYLTFGYGLLWPLALWGGWYTRPWRNRRLRSLPAGLLCAFSLVWILAMLLITRVRVVAMCVLPLLALPVLGLQKGRQRSLRMAVVFMLLILQATHAVYYERGDVRQWVNARLSPRPALPAYGTREDEDELYQWLQNLTPSDAVVLAPFELGPAILLYGDRAINLQPKFESRETRTRFRAFIQVLYGNDPDALFRLVALFQSTHLMLPSSCVLDAGPDSYRYIADCLELSASSLACRLHVAPDSFPRLRPLARNSLYTLWEVLPTPAETPHTPLGYHPLYDGDALGVQSRVIQADAGARVVRRMRRAYADIETCMALLKNRRSAEAFVLARRVVMDGLPDAKVLITAAEVAVYADKLPDAAAWAKRAVWAAPNDAQTLERSAGIFLIAGQTEEAKAAARRTLELSPFSAEAWVVLGQVAMQNGNAFNARQCFSQALVRRPGDPRIKELYEQTMSYSR